MFKTVDFSETSPVPPGSDTDLAPTQSPHHVGSSQDSNYELLPRGSDDKIDAEKGPHDELSKHLPLFQKRPLSDTPISSNWTSPRITEENTPSDSPENSATNLKSLHRLHINDETKLKNGNIPMDDVADYIPPSNETNEITRIDLKDIKSPSRHHKRRPTTIDVPGLTKSKTSPDGLISKEDSGSKLVIVMVGLPATGKSFITNKLSRFLNYSLYYCKVFNVGNTRRRFARDHGLKDQDSNFFDPKNSDSTRLRDKWAMDTLDELLDYLLEGAGSVGIFDATNTSRERRKNVLAKIRKRSPHLKVLFLESVCSDHALVQKNIRLKLFGPDYKGKDPESSLRDFKSRLANYLKAYEPIEDDENLQYIKMIDVGKKVIAYNIQGFLASQTVYYLLNFNLADRQIWITRSGESEDNVSGRIGGNSHLTPRGLRFARSLPKFIARQREIFYQNLILQKKNIENPGKNLYSDFFVWTSMRARTIETAQYFNEDDYPIKQMKMLDELSAGDYDGMTYPEIQNNFSEEFEKRQKDKLRYRYPGIGGESYMDVINRLRPVITELERIEDNVLIITHRVVARALLGYFMNLSMDIIANLDVPLHCVYCLEPKPYGITWSLWEYDETSDSFSKVPQTDLNTTRVKEVGLVYNERRYSVIPTAPPSARSSFASDFLSRKKSNVASSSSSQNDLSDGPKNTVSAQIGSNNTTINESNSNSNSNNNNNSTSKIPLSAPLMTTNASNNILDGGGTSISIHRPRIVPNLNNVNPLLANNSNAISNTVNLKKSQPTARQMFEIDKVDEKLSMLKNKNFQLHGKNYSTENDDDDNDDIRAKTMTRSQSHV
ncbi:6-phosphofructo-2-kinase [Saccharomyces eubayanus]|uniref:6-phosphofructo-2-kinase n=1 Tax=Saccharomyces eubayanus TaxID=1080349 RepID=UPI0006C46629|nr:PFK26-like protein [Saccharomyces eubayanus]KOG98796.1 PFK26-like protein [Saccharomyces eubayanus]